MISDVNHWLRSNLDLNVAEATLVVAVLTLLVAIPAIVPEARRAFRRAAWRALVALRFAHRKYVRWFIAQRSKITNIYLNRTEELDLAQTYISLFFVDPGAAREQRIIATNLLAQNESAHIIIVGDPGSGKSTLLNAYGTGILQRTALHASSSDLKLVTQSHEIPFLVRLRHFAKYAEGESALVRYVTENLLEKQANIRGAENYLRRVLQQDRCLIMLDGLDEVPDNKYDAVRDAIVEFSKSTDPSLPTGKARIILSCRKQNFLRIKSDWIPTFAPWSHVLAPLRDAEIFRFILKRQGEFVSPRTPDAFFSSLQASGTLDLHRVPLILTISLGMYLQLSAYEIPRSIGRFYEEMINGLLIRHDFPGDPSGHTNRFNAEDKYRFLREFALAMARRPGRFEDFDFGEIVDFAAAMIPKMSYVAAEDSKEFVREIIDRSGLLTRTSDEDEYIFAHRSIQEYLIAVQLRRDSLAGMQFLLDRANDSEWRQVSIYYAALDHENVEAFLAALSDRNLELAGQCLASSAPVSEELVGNILNRLSLSISKSSSFAANLAALVSITGAQKATTRTRATAVLSEVLTSLQATRTLCQYSGMTQRERCGYWKSSLRPVHRR
jgi:energy-coupling factor transporter ATP-binding protein EcfA2